MQSAEHREWRLISMQLYVVFGTKSAFDCLRFGKFPPHICDLSAPPTDIAANRLVRCKARLAIPLTDVENCDQIDP